jgi:hypothetical protein
MLLKDLQVSGDQLEISGPSGPFLYRYLEYCIQERTLGPFSPFGSLGILTLCTRRDPWVPSHSLWYIISNSLVYGIQSGLLTFLV